MLPHGRGKLPGFDTLRLLGSLSVLFSHSYLIAQDTDASEPFQMLLRGEKNIAGLYGVFVFFILSGFLLSRSLHHNPSILRFITNRLLRLLPGFIFCILITAWIIAPLCSRDGPMAYFASGAGWPYFRDSLRTLNDAPLSGLFNYTSSVSQVVNGSLWSLRIEVLCYALLLSFWSLFPSPGWVALAWGGLGAFILFDPAHAASLPVNTYPLPYFAAGVVVWWLCHHLGMGRPVAYMCLAGLTAGVLLGFPHLAFAVFGAYSVIALGCRFPLLDPWIARTGDLSYGVYLFGWPIQQMLRQWLDLRQPLLMFVLSAVVTGLLAYVSFHWVEQPGMALRTPLLRALEGFRLPLPSPDRAREGSNAPSVPEACRSPWGG
ncbi:MAG: acyltransferase [Cyanobacteriota bacterium]|nr:acyltransferase [Cyanobacteriota bacterium]